MMESAREEWRAPCPDCRHFTLRPSRPKKLKDRLMKLVGKRPMRCRTCGKRFYVRPSDLVLAEHE